MHQARPCPQRTWSVISRIVKWQIALVYLDNIVLGCKSISQQIFNHHSFRGVLSDVRASLELKNAFSCMTKLTTPVTSLIGETSDSRKSNCCHTYTEGVEKHERIVIFIPFVYRVRFIPSRGPVPKELIEHQSFHFECLYNIKAKRYHQLQPSCWRQRCSTYRGRLQDNLWT